MFDHIKSRIRKPDLPFAKEDYSKTNEGSIFSNRDERFISFPVMRSLHHVFWPQSLISPIRANVQTSLLFNLFNFDIT